MKKITKKKLAEYIEYDRKYADGGVSDNDEFLMTFNGAAKYLNVSFETLRKFVNKGEVEYLKLNSKIIRFEKYNLKIFLSNKCDEQYENYEKEL